MSIHAGPNTIKNGLVLHLDASNPKSYPGTGTAWFDLSGNNNHGTLTNMSVPSCYVRTYGGRAIQFDGTNDYVSIARQASDFGLLSLSLWFSPRSASGQQRGLFEWSNTFTSTTPFILITQQDPGTLHRIYVDGDYRVTINTIANTWNSITLCQEPGFLWRVYLNGLSVGTYQDDATSQWKSIATMINIGAGYLSYFNGQIDDIRIYNRALSLAEIRQNYNATRGRFGL